MFSNNIRTSLVLFLLFFTWKSVHGEIESLQSNETYQQDGSGDLFMNNIKWTTCRYPEMTRFLHDLVANYSTISRLYTIGKTFEGRDLWVVLISNEPYERPLLRPQVKYVGNVNGNSGPSCFILLKLITNLLTSFRNESSLERQVIESNEIHIMPNMNPDGFLKSDPGACRGDTGRQNAAGAELNRDFNAVDPTLLQPETRAIMNWIDENSFVLSLTFISGVVVVSYPYDSAPPNSSADYKGAHSTPDNDMFNHLALGYVNELNSNSEYDSAALSKSNYCPGIKRTFNSGIVNGAEWAPATGTMMDYNYKKGVLEVLIGISCCRNENNQDILNSIWKNNKPALVNMILQTEFSFRGQVIDKETSEPIAGALIRKIKQYGDEMNSVPFTTTDQGEFWRLSLPGKFKLITRAEGYEKSTVKVEMKMNRGPEIVKIELIRERDDKNKGAVVTPQSSSEGQGEILVGRSNLIGEEDLTEEETKLSVIEEHSWNWLTTLITVLSCISILLLVLFIRRVICRLPF